MELLLMLAFCAIILLLLSRFGGRRKRVFVVVLGDIGRSPRMQYHAISFAKSGFEVFIVGYGGSRPQTDVLSNPNIRLVHLPQMSNVLQRSLPRFKSNRIKKFLQRRGFKIMKGFEDVNSNTFLRLLLPLTLEVIH